MRYKNPPGQGHIYDNICNVSNCPLPYRNILLFGNQAVRERYIGEGACNCGSNFLAPLLCRILWVLSWRDKKVPPPAGTGTIDTTQSQVKKRTAPAGTSAIDTHESYIKTYRPRRGLEPSIHLKAISKRTIFGEDYAVDDVIIG